LRETLAFRTCSKAKAYTSLDDISEAEISNWGYKVYKKIWAQYKLERILSAIKESTRARFDISQSTFLMVLDCRPSLALNHYVSTIEPPVSELYLKLNNIGKNNNLIVILPPSFGSLLFSNRGPIHKHLIGTMGQSVQCRITQDGIREKSLPFLRSPGRCKDG